MKTKNMQEWDNERGGYFWTAKQGEQYELDKTAEKPKEYILRFPLFKLEVGSKRKIGGKI